MPRIPALHTPLSPMCFDAAWCPSTKPFLLAGWDVDSLPGTVASNAPVITWSSNGTSGLAMQGNGVSGNMPMLYYDHLCVPYVHFTRENTATWFQSGSLTIPSCAEEARGLTLVVTARMFASIDVMAAGSAWERLFQCADGRGANYLTLARRDSGNDLTLLWGNNGAYSQLYTPGPAINGSFQTFVFRMAPDGTGAVYTNNALTALTSDPSQPSPLSVPRTFANCYLGKAADDAYSLAGGIRELSLWVGACLN